jgi:hypothetical protein
MTPTTGTTTRVAVATRLSTAADLPVLTSTMPTPSSADPTMRWIAADEARRRAVVRPYPAAATGG